MRSYVGAFVLLMPLLHGKVLSSSLCTNVTRAEWGARAPEEVVLMHIPVGMVFIHHSAMQRCFNFSECARQMRGIQNFHMDTRGWSDIAYNFLVGEDGRVYEGRGWNKVGAHTRGYNDVAVAICVMGNFQNVAPNSRALTAVQNTIACGVKNGKLTEDYRLYGHRDSKKSVTDCPGQTLYDIIRLWDHYDPHGPPPELHPRPRVQNIL